MQVARSSVPLAAVMLSLWTALDAQAPPPSLSPAVSLTLPADVTSLVAVNRSPRVAAGLSDGRVAIWSPTEAAPSLVLQPHKASVLAVAATGDGTQLISVASDGTLSRTPIAPGASSAVSNADLGPTPPRAAVFSADGSRLVIGGERGEVRVLDTTSGAVIRQRAGHRTELHDVATQPGTAVVASASAESDLVVWESSTGTELKRLDCGLSLLALAFSPRDGTLAAGGVGRRLTLYHPRSFETTGGLHLQAPNMVSTLAWAPDGGRLAVGYIDSDSLSKGGILIVQIVGASAPAVLTTLDTGGAPAARLVFGGSGAGAVVAAFGNDLRAWAIAR
jgi:WD40 repeat protein